MTTVPQEKYAPLTSIHGDRLGLSGNGLIPPGVAAGANVFKLAGEYLGGRLLRGLRVGTNAGADYLLSSINQHAMMNDDFIGPALDASKWAGVHGSDGSAASPAIAAALNGVARLTTGAGAGATMAVNGSQMDSALNWQVNERGLRAEFRVGNVSSVANLALFFGFTNEKGTLQMPFTNAANVITGNANDAVGFLFDTSATTQGFWQVGNKAGMLAANAALTEASAAAPGGAAVFHTYRIEVDVSGNASFFIDGIQVGPVLLNAVSANVALTPVVAAFARAAASKTIDVDYAMVQQIRL